MVALLQRATLHQLRAMNEMDPALSARYERSAWALEIRALQLMGEDGAA